MASVALAVLYVSPILFVKLSMLTILSGLPQCVRTPPPEGRLSQPRKSKLIEAFPSSVEHGAVNVVAVNDPFIEPKYAVSPPDFSPRSGGGNCP